MLKMELCTGECLKIYIHLILYHSVFFVVETFLTGVNILYKDCLRKLLVQNGQAFEFPITWQDY